ncbi:MAG: YjaG family protein [Oceanospirillaceae bacterium]|nr:YjaG family protein [Oceanospirillaceae bacterium]
MNDDFCLETPLKALDKPQLIAYCVAISARQFPNFALFSQIVEFGDAKKMATLIDGIWQSLIPGGAKMNFELQQSKVEDNMPDLDTFDMYGAAPALDAMTCLHATLSCILQGEYEEAVTIGLVSRETVASFVEVSEGNDQMSDEEIMRLISNHPLMEQEDEFQAQLLERLENSKSLNKEFIASLRELATNHGVSNIGISVD